MAGGGGDVESEELMDHQEIREEVKALIAFYESEKRDWVSALEYHLRKLLWSLPWQEKKRGIAWRNTARSRR